MKKIRLIFMTLIMLLLVCVSMFAFGSCNDAPPVDKTGEEEDMAVISDAFFTFEKYNVVILGPGEKGDNFSLFSKNRLDIHGKCINSLDRVTATIELYDDMGELKGRYTVRSQNTVKANESFVLSVEISDKVKDSFSIVKVKYEGRATEKTVYRVEDFTNNITYIYNNGQRATMVTVNWKSTVTRPDDPYKNGYRFEGWYTDPKFTEPFDFENTIPSDDLVLYAKYSLDLATMGQMMITMLNPSVVKITTKSSTSLVMGFVEVTSHEKEGEGVIIRDSSGYYYVLTANDAIEKKAGFEKVSYTIEDYYGNVYEGKLKHHSENYNLAVLYFEKGAERLGVANIADDNSSSGETIALIDSYDSIGVVPNFGLVSSYEKVDHEIIGTQASDVDFEMMTYNIEQYQRIMGRPVFDVNLNLIGIQCGNFYTFGNVYDDKVGHAIPVEMIKKYIDAYGL